MTFTICCASCSEQLYPPISITRSEQEVTLPRFLARQDSNRYSARVTGTRSPLSLISLRLVSIVKSRTDISLLLLSPERPRRSAASN